MMPPAFVYPGPLFRQPEQRASDADRDIAVDMLCAAVADGRLTLSELDERVGVALSARTLTELARLLADLSASATVSGSVTLGASATVGAAVPFGAAAPQVESGERASGERARSERARGERARGERGSAGRGRVDRGPGGRANTADRWALLQSLAAGPGLAPCAHA